MFGKEHTKRTVGFSPTNQTESEMVALPLRAPRAAFLFLGFSVFRAWVLLRLLTFMFGTHIAGRMRNVSRYGLLKFQPRCNRLPEGEYVMKRLQRPAVAIDCRALLRDAVLWQGDDHFARANRSV